MLFNTYDTGSTHWYSVERAKALIPLLILILPKGGTEGNIYLRLSKKYESFSSEFEE